MARKQAKMLWLIHVVLLGIACSVLLIVLFATNVGSLPITSLPVWYWLLTAGVLMLFAITPIFKTERSAPDIMPQFTVVSYAICALFFLSAAIITLVTQPERGGWAVLHMMIGVLNLFLLGPWITRLRAR